MLNFKIILLIGLLADSALATATIRCSSERRCWCQVHDALENPSNGEKLTIENTSHKSNVTHFQWIRQSNVKHMPTIIFETFSGIEIFDLSIGIEVLRETDFENARNLSHLIMLKNGISRIPSNVFRRASNLKSITLDANKIIEVQDFAFKDLNKLIQIRLNYNSITSLTRNTFAGTPRLHTIYLKVNEITSIEDGTFNLPRLTEIYLNSNRIQTIPDRLFANAPLLTHIDLTDNEITQLPPALFAVPKLKTLILEWNQLENVQISEFTRLKKLNVLSLENTGILLSREQQKLSESMLTKINLGDNGITNPDTLKHLRMFGNLQEIILSSNKLTYLYSIGNVRKFFPNITKIDLSDNEMRCSWLLLPIIRNLEIELSTADEDTDGQRCGEIRK